MECETKEPLLRKYAVLSDDNVEFQVAWHSYGLCDFIDGNKYVVLTDRQVEWLVAETPKYMSLSCDYVIPLIEMKEDDIPHTMIGIKSLKVFYCSGSLYFNSTSEMGDTFTHSMSYDHFCKMHKKLRECSEDFHQKRPMDKWIRV